MKRLIIILTVLLCATQGFAQKEKTMYVAVKKASVKTSTGFFASTAGSLVYGDMVTVVQQKGKWSQVRYSGAKPFSGWLTTASLTSKRVIAGATSSASASELALAGKGFSAEVEQEYKKETSLNFAGVDTVESIAVSDNDLKNFITEGHLAGDK